MQLCIILDKSPSLGPRAKPITLVHPLDAEEPARFFIKGVKHYKMYAKAIAIGSGTVIGASSVVTKALPSGVLVGGVPAKIIKNLHK